MEQTTVEWLYNKMLYIDNEYDMKVITKSEYKFKRRDIIKQAKEMEKEQRGYSEEDVRLAYQRGEEDSYLKGGQTKEMENEFIQSLKQKR